MSENVICSDQRHLIDRPVPEGITGIYLFKYEAEQALTSSASCDLPSSYGLSWQTNATGEWEFEWERPGGYDCGCPSAFWIKAEHLQFLNYLTSLISPTGTAPQRPKADPKPEDGDVWSREDHFTPPEADSGIAPAPQTEGECPDCGGKGYDGTDSSGPNGMPGSCPTCSGTGKEKA